MYDLFLFEVKLLAKLTLNEFDVSSRQLYLVNYGNNCQSGLEGFVEVGYRLGLDTFCCVYDQNRALASSYAATDLVREIDVALSKDCGQ